MEDPHMVEELMAAFDGGGTSWAQQQPTQQASAVQLTLDLCCPRWQVAVVKSLNQGSTRAGPLLSKLQMHRPCCRDIQTATQSAQIHRLCSARPTQH